MFSKNLLKNRFTINKTYENFYENRLLTDPNNINRKIEYSTDCMIKSEGIHTISVNHTDRSQTSIEEYEVIKKLMKQFLK